MIYGGDIMEKFILIDGHSLAYRAFYALPLMVNKNGQYTNAVYGFTMMLMRLLEEEKPDYVAVSFDLPKPTFRHEAFKDYKGNRQKAPEEFIPQITLIKEICQVFRVPIIEKEGFEADDVIGTLARMGEKEGVKVYVVTGDRDSFQLISENVFIMLTRKGVTQIDLIDKNVLQEMYSLSPQQIVDLKALMGDKSDNIPGIPGVGEKTALKLLHQFGNIENLYQHIETVKGVKLIEKLRSNEDLALLSYKLAKIECDIPMDMELNAFKIKDYHQDEVIELFKNLEFNKLLGKIGYTQIDKKEIQAEIDRNLDVHLIENWNDAQVVIKHIMTQQEVTCHFLMDGNNPRQGKLLGLGLKPLNKEYYYLSFKEETEAVLKQKIGWFRDIFNAPHIKINCSDSKRAYQILKRFGINTTAFYFDPLVAAYLLQPSETEYNVKKITKDFLQNNSALLDDLVGKCKKYACIDEVSPEEIVYGTAAEMQQVEALKPILLSKLENLELNTLFEEVEMPLTRVLGEMEFTGIVVDPIRLEELKQEMGQHLIAVEKKIFAQAGEKINLNSPKQLGNLLFEKMNIPPVKKTKTGYSTNAEVLEKLAPQYEIAAFILEYRQVMKLKSTYVDGLKKLIDEQTNRIHTTFNQLVTTTGRLSSTEPNLQNIPIRSAEGRKIREVFVPQEGYQILAADYSQIELRILAHLSEDDALKEAFIQKEDIHTKTAAEVFGVSKDDVTPEMRRRAKAVNFGIVYGISDYGLSRDLKISRREAKQYIDKYFARYPGVKIYMEKAIGEARETGYASTLLKRRRYLPDLHHKNKNIRQFAERTAMNTPIQGSAADLIKIAMVTIFAELSKQQLKSQMLLQVHDELIFAVPEDELHCLADLTKEIMENALKLNVPLVVDFKAGYNWNQMNPMKI